MKECSVATTGPPICEISTTTTTRTTTTTNWDHRQVVKQSVYLVPELRYPCHCCLPCYCRRPYGCPRLGRRPPPPAHRHHEAMPLVSLMSSRKPHVSIKSQS